MRYEHLRKRVRRLQPASIMEVGTWIGVRAHALLSECPNATYYGFDLFEDMTPELDALELNIKRHSSVAEVQKLLAEFQHVNLIKGNTRETLRDFAPEQPIEFVWLDGGHSIETIASDWANVKRVIAPWAEVWFDDYYTEGPDTRVMGCNSLVETIRHEVWPQRDPVTGGGYTQMVRVWP